jgi:hypothetical protein
MNDLDSIADRLALPTGLFLALAAAAVEVFVAIPLVFQTPTAGAPLRGPLGTVVLSGAVVAALLVSVRLIGGTRRLGGGLFSWFTIAFWGAVFLGAGLKPPAAVSPRHMAFFSGFSLLLAAGCFWLAYDRYRRRQETQ